MRTVNRWYALCDYQGWDDECTQVTEVPSFEGFRALLQETASRGVRKGRNRDLRHRVHPAECHVYKVQAPRGRGSDRRYVILLRRAGAGLSLLRMSVHNRRGSRLEP